MAVFIVKFVSFICKSVVDGDLRLAHFIDEL